MAVLGACSAGGDDDDAAAPAATEAPAAEALAAQDAGGSGGETADIAATMQIPGQAIAIEARASLQADDVAAAVDEVTASVTTRGGRVAAADIDYVSDEAPDERTGSRATLVLEVPPDQLGAVVDALEELGTVLSFDQLAEDVTEQLADLDTRITNLRASIERVRALYSEAVDIDSIVRLEAELTQRETTLEQLLASQQALEDRVAMSTLTVDIAVTPEVLQTDDDPGLADALGAGWDAFVSGLFAIVLVLAAAAPFLATAAVVSLGVLWLRRRLVTANRQG